jgi:hypothetical protein
VIFGKPLEGSGLQGTHPLVIESRDFLDAIRALGGLSFVPSQSKQPRANPSKINLHDHPGNH